MDRAVCLAKFHLHYLVVRTSQCFIPYGTELLGLSQQSFGLIDLSFAKL